MRDTRALQREDDEEIVVGSEHVGQGGHVRKCAVKSAYARAALVQDVAVELAHDRGRRQPRPTAATAPSLPMKPVVARPSASAPRAAPKR
ncbi:hypothetical protein [Streptomyces sp. TN58]|uniref:hypothetical protein n=1 Tax=Streptomyces sp. TN58 TaxID=234612 RepID=UPI0009507E90|nr:hypothetical protein [Streptomyces sp. TN58]APU42948.1 hypothetical protein BSL84_27355 [Streptomyces sp. TN58]